MKRSEFIKTSALSALLAPSAFMGLAKNLNTHTNTKNVDVLFCSTCGTKFTSSIHTSQD